MITRTTLGAAGPVSGEIASGVGVAGGTIAAVASTGALATIGITASFVPIIGPIVGGITLLIAALGVGNGCGQTCVATTNIVNKIEPYMQQNLQAAQQQASANGGWLTSAEKQQALANFDSLWQTVVDNCQQVGGPGGKNCVQDRQAGGKWDWNAYYRKPIESIPLQPIPVQPPASVSQPASVASVLESLTGGGSVLTSGGSSIGISPMLLIAGLVVIVIIAS